MHKFKLLDIHLYTLLHICPLKPGQWSRALIPGLYHHCFFLVMSHFQAKVFVDFLLHHQRAFHSLLWSPVRTLQSHRQVHGAEHTLKTVLSPCLFLSSACRASTCQLTSYAGCFCQLDTNLDAVG